jgi:hypothetical protein
MKKNLVIVFAVMVMMLSACSLGSAPAQPKAGHWEGSNPAISFEVTDDGQIIGFSMKPPYGGSTCNIYIASVPVQSDYTINLDLTSMETLSMGYINGTFQGTKASGKFLIQMCSQGISFVPGEDEDRDWSAEWVGETTP